MRERLSLDRNWRFALGHAANPAADFEFARSRCLVKAGEGRGAASPKFDDSAWKQIDVPHDWAIELPFDEKGDKELAEHGFHAIGPDHPEHSVGWYRRKFDIPASDLGRRICVEFDGVFRDSVVWINGHRLARHASGYTPFRYDLTDMINYGGSNLITVRVDATSWEGWWYEGAGIYRHVWLVKTDPVHIAPSGTFVTSQVGKDSATVTIRTRVMNDSHEPAMFVLASTVSDADGKALPTVRSKQLRIAPNAEVEIRQTQKIRKPKLWSCDDPHLYSLASAVVLSPSPGTPGEGRGEGASKSRTMNDERGAMNEDDTHRSSLIAHRSSNHPHPNPLPAYRERGLRRGKIVVDEYQTTFGIRTLKWDAKRGFFLNGQSLKIKGTCNHQQHAGVGIAMPDRLQEFRIAKLKELGSNAYRCSHYAATPELLDACDRHGLLVMAENRLGGSSPEVIDQFRTMIVRDRNHPSIILWSLANEEHTIQWAIAGERIGRTMIELAHRLDPTRKVTTAMHDRGLGEGFANVVDVHGWNYIAVGDIEAFHARRPDQPIVGSEEGSTVCTRGIYADDEQRGYVNAYDIRKPKWGSNAEKWWSYFADRPWIAGGFVWTGFDYFGEPIPYQWPCTASHFGLMDLCGFPKDLYYYFKSWWSNETVLHLLPHWNWAGREGQPIDVWCFSNCEQVELLLNGRSIGRQTMSPNSHLAWQVPYEPGVLEARGFNNAGRRVATTKRETTGSAAVLRLLSDRPNILANGEDVAAITVSVTDAEGRAVPTANDQLSFEITGEGHLIGVGNGDPSSHESDKAPARKLFNGLGQILIQSSTKPGTIQVKVHGPQLKDAVITVRTVKAKARPSVP